MSKNTKDTEAQHARFVEAARALGCDEDEAAFDEKLLRIAGHKPGDVSTNQVKPTKGKARPA